MRVGAWEQLPVYSCYPAVYSCYSGCTAAIPVYSCSSGCTAAIPVYSCYSRCTAAIYPSVQLLFRVYSCYPGVQLLFQVYSCYSCVQLLFLCTANCYPGVQLLSWCTAAILVYSCYPSVQLLGISVYGCYPCVQLLSSYPTTTIPTHTLLKLQYQALGITESYNEDGSPSPTPSPTQPIPPPSDDFELFDDPQYVTASDIGVRPQVNECVCRLYSLFPRPFPQPISMAIDIENNKWYCEHSGIQPSD